MGKGRKTGVEGVHIVKRARRDGSHVWHIYAWRGGPNIRSVEGGPKPKVSREDIAAIADAQADKGYLTKGTLAGLIADYRNEARNPEWAKLATSTRRLWNNCLNKIVARWGETPIRFWNSNAMLPKIMKWRAEMAGTPRSGDEHISMLGRVLTFGRFHAGLVVNVAADIPKLYKGSNRSEIIWTDEDLKILQKTARPQVWDAVRLAYMTGLRREDLVNLKWSEVGEFAITHVASKVSAGKQYTVTMPAVPGLKALLAELKTRRRNPGVDTILVNSFGDQWTGDGFSTSFIEDRNEADIHYLDNKGEKKWKRLHDLRGTFATYFMTQTHPMPTNQEVATVMGWSVEQVEEIRKKYVDRAAIVTALGERMRKNDVNRGVNREV